jgi:hypothetical protein
MIAPIILAHGALGWWDELVFIGIISIFLMMMGVSWFRSRGADYDQQDLMPTSPDNNSSESSDERFQLD